MAERVRVLELVVSSEFGGGPAHVWDLVVGLPKGEFDVAVAGPGGGPYVDAYRQLGIDFVDVRADRLSLGALLRVIRLVRDRRIQVIHSHGKGAGLYGRLAAWWLGAAAIHTFHGIHYRGYGPLYVWGERFLARHSYAVVHVSDSQAQEAARLGLAPAGRSLVIPNGTDSAAVRAAAEDEPVPRAAIGLSEEALVLGTVARFDQVKGLDVLLRAFARVLERLPEARLLVVGDGPEAVGLRTLAGSLALNDRVIFAGSIPRAARCLPALDLYVSASRREGLPLAVLEAMACGLAVVATCVPGHVDAVEHGVTGVLVPPDAPEALGDAVVALLRDGARRQAMGRAGRERVERCFALGPMLRRVAALYREAARFPRGPARPSRV
jgi:glycosyltransferase involved in cell wall biosynthesis